ncbi:A/G-specific DNA-adenine glycosylase [Methylobacillus rhizosphaerae]|uniref:Adenine DNA glycosylase n=1 Tax=Methylobacillus rhizosphaerae TaxID=551994 RepID=A0A238XR34_9PROT|nr:A/G-specific adenine glycosylase [Methylobacillus rhizosphaerae]SNR61038.1 A/G-specific DNA-adenine glycosylase [Methylobacillus rhizosphaerae]
MEPKPFAPIAERLIAWQKQHGRHDLPWQNTTDPYAIWVSEIMLQQTQVAAVITYYLKFMQRFPDIASLASASQEDVLQYWSGLGYYSRARNLHKAAQIIMQQHGGNFPQDFEAIQALPGIGRSTAAAISSFAFGLSQPILDGNVKRVFARYFLIEDWPGLPRVEKTLWQLAEAMQPESEMGVYAQGLMDMGATLCTRTRPRCDICPLQEDCGAWAANRVKELPASKPRKAVPERTVQMLVLCHADKVLLEKRPESGIWGGLWSLPELGLEQDGAAWAMQALSMPSSGAEPLVQLTHVFTHFRLHISAQRLTVPVLPLQAQEPRWQWMSLDEAIHAALPVPVRKILQVLAKQHHVVSNAHQGQLALI